MRVPARAGATAGGWGPAGRRRPVAPRRLKRAIRFGALNTRTRLRRCRSYLTVMLLRMRKKPPAASYQRRRRLEIAVLARNLALHYLANHPLTDDERAQLTEVVHGYTGPCDVIAAREGLAWLRERYRERGERAPF